MTGDCYPCRLTASLAEQPASERIALHRGWRVTHAFDSALPGWLVVLPLRHVTRLSELDGDEAAALGPLLTAVSGALETVTACVKTYVMLFAEQEGFGHVHFHVVPRMPDFDAETVGPRVFRFLGAPEGERVRQDERDRLASALGPEIEARL